MPVCRDLHAPYQETDDSGREQREVSEFFSHTTVGGCRRLVHVDLEVRSATRSWRTDVRHHKKAPAFMRRAGNSEAYVGLRAPGPVQPHHAEAAGGGDSASFASFASFACFL